MDGSAIVVIAIAAIVVIVLAVPRILRSRSGRDSRSEQARRRAGRGPDGGVETAAVVGLVGGSVLAGDDHDDVPGHGWDPRGVADAGGGWGGFGGGDGGGDGGGGGGD